MYDKPLLLLTILLTVIGTIFVADVSGPQAQAFFGDNLYFIKQQLLWGSIGIVAMFLGMHIHYTFWKKIAIYLFGISVILLILVLIPGFGSKLLGARRWLSFGPFNLQPSEIVKLTLAMYLASLVAAERKVIYFLVPISIVAILVLLQPDLGTTLIITVVGFTQIFLGGISITYLIGILAGGGILGFLVILFSSYRKQRLTHFLQSLNNPLNSSYHVKQILLALGSGGLLGVGIGQSRQKFLFLPEAATDSVFPIIAEEIGFIGATFIIVLLTIFVIRCLRCSRNAPDKFSFMLAAGIASWLGSQIFINLGSMLALIPLTGVPLPFFSYGGSSLTMVLFGIGILLNIAKYAKKES